MKKLIVILLIALSGTITYSQNLVPNPSFEQFDTCPDQASMIHYATNWMNANTGTSDYYNTCYVPGGFNDMGVPNNFMGSQNAKSGNAYAGFLASEEINWNINYREYISVKLLDSLTLGMKYYVSFHLSLSDSSLYATDDVGLYLSNDSIWQNNTDSLNYTPQIKNTEGLFLINKNGWMQVKNTFIAQGGEKYLTIGNFNGHATTDSLFIGNGGNPSYYNFPYYYIDDVCVSLDSTDCYNNVGIEDKNLDEISIYPNPANDILNINLKNISSVKIVSIDIYNLNGKLIFQDSFYNTSDLKINISDFSFGMYFMKLYIDNKKLITKSFIKN